MLDNAKGVTGSMEPEKLVNHMKLVHYQLLRVRTALALATITGRVLVLPPIWCEIDKYWAPLLDGEAQNRHRPPTPLLALSLP